MANLLQPKEFPVTITAEDGTVTNRVFILSKFPAVAGREIVAQYPVSALPKVGDYKTNEAIMLRLMSFVAVITEAGATQRLQTRELVDNHVPDWETLAKLEVAMMEYNCSFFRDGRVSTFFDNFAQKAQALILQTLTGLLAQSSQAGRQPSSSSETTTPSKKP